MVNASTVSFLRDLSENNDRDWFDANRKRYEAAKKDVAGVINRLLEGMVLFDERLAGLTAKDSMFRIFRDTRFSKNKAPYKNNLGGWMAPSGRKSPFAGYYLHIQPGGQSFLAGGVYHPESQVLKAIREAIDYDGEKMQAIIQSAAFKQYFGEMGGETLKTSPKGYDKDHQFIDLLRHKSFLMQSDLSDADLVAEDFVERTLDVFKQMLPLNNYLNKAIEELSS